ncbi:MAG: redoxin domain-containing protein [Bacteroidia bacterium]|nr:redoxin domain-containing protein [Bacteroidia bacterium]
MKKRKTTAIVIMIVLLGVFLFFMYSIGVKSNRKKEIAKKLETIPQFEFFQLNGKPFTQDSIKEQFSAIFIYFHTDCDFCSHEAESIAEHLSGLHNSQLLFISPEPTDSIQAFAEKKNLSNHPNVLFLQDKKRVFPVRFDVNAAPYTLVYNKNGKLIKRFNGQILAPAIIKVLQENERE